MTNTSHTPGPWGLHIGNDYCRVLMKPDSCTDDMIAEVYSDGMGKEYEDDDRNREANARLIAAAPDLFLALKTLLHAETMMEKGKLVDIDVWDVFMETARAAIAKAKGE